ncbi:uncharacterized protein TM35_000142990 [Trypanosoma theileri]|uniref:Uncharacterized protein n=1 Tax=Trypanosoma theileri TaxID=67003 RepID=A0A1X0NX15_9TRYP|nr:uncharacterized protein TM35_000142990 [Trypanosoma theileri]ORC89088.1 hypothetical protein TM35_000142990 [Trypanosoma theileri]
MIRDNKAWRRALRQRDVQECLAPSSRAAKSNMGPLFRRGCTDNVYSLRFVNFLRASDDSSPNTRERQKALQQRMQALWNPSTKISSCSSDTLLHNLLLHQLKLHGFSLGYKESRDAILKEQVREASQRRKKQNTQEEKERIENYRQKENEICNNEFQQRKLIMNKEKQRRDRIVADMHEQELIIMTNAEFAQRRKIFQEAYAQYNSIREEADRELQSITGISLVHLKEYFGIIQQEKDQRHNIIHLFQKQRKSMKTQLHMQLQKLVHAEIERITQQEKIIHQLIQLNSTIQGSVLHQQK